MGQTTSHDSYSDWWAVLDSAFMWGDPSPSQGLSAAEARQFADRHPVRSQLRRKMIAA
jgi:hypothetical protein